MHRWRDRNQNEMFMPSIKPKFKIGRGAKFFMFGSCFARGLEKELHDQGVKVLSIPDKDLPLDTNRFHAPSILQAIRGVPQNTKESYVQSSPGLWYDPYLQFPKKPTHALDELSELRTRVEEIDRRHTEADVVVVVLGMTETWWDEELKLYTHRYMAIQGKRFSFRNLSTHQNRRALRQIIAALPMTKIIVTVSPVPLVATFSGQDIVVANAYSKSVLRAVAQEVAEEHGEVDYFPAYEIALHSREPWREDGRHVKEEVRKHIMQQFTKHYIEDE